MNPRKVAHVIITANTPNRLSLIWREARKK
jgi:hypothetical protein